MTSYIGGRGYRSQHRRQTTFNFLIPVSYWLENYLGSIYEIGDILAFSAAFLIFLDRQKIGMAEDCMVPLLICIFCVWYFM